MEVSPYKPPSFLFNKHIETVFPALFRRVDMQPFERERIDTPDNDFLDIDWWRRGSDKIVILSHGLEGNSQRAYMKGMAHAFLSNGYDALSWSYRGCGEDMNTQLRFYHSGASEDLDVVINHVIAKGYKKIILVGFSLGGNLTLKFTGEKHKDIQPEIKGVIGFSVPLNLASSCAVISEPGNRIYADRFLRSLKKKIKDKSKLMAGLDARGIEKIHTLLDFDDRYTAPLHGFKDAVTYYSACSALYFLPSISIPTLIVSAMNDPFLSPDCYPETSNPFVFTVYPEYGGHTGFASFNREGLYWSEQQALRFAEKALTEEIPG